MRYEESDLTESGNFKAWLLTGLVLSLLLHALFLWWSGNFVPSRFGEAYYEKIVPRKFKIERVEIDPASLADSDEPELQKVEPARPQPVELPEEVIALESPGLAKPAAPAPLPPARIQSEKPDLAPSIANSLESIAPSKVSDPVAELDAIRRQLEENTPASAARPILPLPSEQAGGGTGEKYAIAPGYSGLDELLSLTGPLEKGTAPIFLPGELLFDYDSAELKPRALEELRKLGELIFRNPHVRFVIEGHTDSFGSPEYNLALSKRRAEAVKEWIINNTRADPSKISTIGRGSSMLIVPATESIEGQKYNRRVEIVMEFPQ
jgi:outer membrane protein OmpA-like peptidoglycan-associated protein